LAELNAIADAIATAVAELCTHWSEYHGDD
jgi:hypothetical protein